MSKDLQSIAEQLMGKDSAGALSANADSIRRLAQSKDGQKVRQLIGDEQKVADAVASGDTEAMKEIVRTVLGTAEGARLARQLTDLLK